MSDRQRPEQPQVPRGTRPVSPASPTRPADGAVQTPRVSAARSEARRAVALTYDPDGSEAPVVTAVGQGAVAEEIIRRAREAGVPVTEDPRLAAVLSQLDVGREIPPELYVVIAEVLAYVYSVDERVGRRRL